MRSRSLTATAGPGPSPRRSSSNDSPFRGADKFGEVPPLGNVGQLDLDPDERLLQLQLRPEQDPISTLNRLDALPGEAATLQSNGVDPVRFRRSAAHGLHERKSVLRDDGEATDECVLPDPAELVDGGKGAYGREVGHFDMPRQGGP